MKFERIIYLMLSDIDGLIKKSFAYWHPPTPRPQHKTPFLKKKFWNARFTYWFTLFTDRLINSPIVQRTDWQSLLKSCESLTKNEWIMNERSINLILVDIWKKDHWRTWQCNIWNVIMNKHSLNVCGKKY